MWERSPPAIPVLREAPGLTLVEAGCLLSMVQMGGTIAGVFVGVATDSIGRRCSVVSGQLILAIASLCGMWDSARPTCWYCVLSKTLDFSLS